jgi:hypothetical protein
MKKIFSMKAVGILLAAVAALILLACVVATLIPTVASLQAAKLRVGMTLEETHQALGGRLFLNDDGPPVSAWVFRGKNTPRNFSDGSTLVVEFTEAPHRIAAIHIYGRDFGRLLEMRFRDLHDWLGLPRHDPDRYERPLRPH